VIGHGNTGRGMKTKKPAGLLTPAANFETLSLFDRRRSPCSRSMDSSSAVCLVRMSAMVVMENEEDVDENSNLRRSMNVYQF